MLGLLLSFITLGPNVYIGGPFLLLIIIAFYQILSGNYWPKTKSILPAEWESKRFAIGKRHNQIVGMLLLGLFAALFMVVPFIGHGSPWWHVLVAFLPVGLAEIYALRRVFKYDAKMCEQLGFMCPHCHKPLYEPRSFINRNGRCPKCGKSILVTP
jgi:hypothetical protein